MDEATRVSLERSFYMRWCATFYGVARAVARTYPNLTIGTLSQEWVSEFDRGLVRLERQTGARSADGS